MSPPDRRLVCFRYRGIWPQGRSRAPWTSTSQRSCAAWSRPGPPTSTSPPASRRRSATRARSSRWRASRCSAARRPARSSTASSTTTSASASRTTNSSTSPTRSPASPASASTASSSAAPSAPPSASCRRRSRPSTRSGVPQVLRELTDKPRGFVLVTGPTGSGKSTTLAAMLDVINCERQDHILTIEDPIEFLHHAQTLDRQPARGRLRRRGLRARPARRPARGPRRDPGRRDARPGDDLHRADRGRDRPPRLRHPAHPVDRADGRPDHRRLPARSSRGRCAPSSRSPCRGSSPSSCCRPPTAWAASSPPRCWCPTPAIRNLIREGKTHQIYAAVQTSGAVGMQTMDADLARLVRAGKITRALAEQRASVPEELKRLLGGAPP